MPRLGVFGGTFDPPHIGHLVAAVNAAHQLRLDRLLLMVANEPWQKVGSRAISPARDRLAMVEAAAEGAAPLEVSDLEVRRGGRSYTADTLAELAVRHPGVELFLVLGADSAAGLDTWERWEEVREMASIAVVTRPGTDRSAIDERWIDAWVEIPRLDISSTDLRERVATGRPLDFLVPPRVVSCITARSLYRGAAV